MTTVCFIDQPAYTPRCTKQYVDDDNDDDDEDDEGDEDDDAHEGDGAHEDEEGLICFKQIH